MKNQKSPLTVLVTKKEMMNEVEAVIADTLDKLDSVAVLFECIGGDFMIEEPKRLSGLGVMFTDMHKKLSRAFHLLDVCETMPVEEKPPHAS